MDLKQDTIVLTFPMTSPVSDIVFPSNGFSFKNLLEMYAEKYREKYREKYTERLLEYDKISIKASKTPFK